jgi:hypothetical protein
MVRRNELVRLNGALGPLQELAVTGGLTFAIKADGPTATELTVTYRVSGDARHGLDKIATVVDGVIGLQARRLKAFAETGKPE